MYHARQFTRSAYAIFTPTVCQGIIPAWWDDRDLPVTYATERDAQREIAEMMMEFLKQFLAGERDFDDAIVCEDFIQPVEVWPDGTIQTEDGHRFGRRES